jgi:LPXTG-motif cell wall-anchored protein
MDLRLTDPVTMALVAGAVLLVAAMAWLFVRRRRTTTANLRRRFGPEYERRCGLPSSTIVRSSTDC